ncbi:hypothetical protein ANN_18145 [Periplaneta americana]|uniref:GH18 domain-containing protein n=1 Tax=Periplaneta americana TaxID=6978 RepID=A0ABQ8SNX3_PERAM|nr:hypothetical protein ANN_18145 [Periplaneta americana]
MYYYLFRYLDFINVMTYDMHGSWESKTGENSPLYAGPSDTSDFERTLNVDHPRRSMTFVPRKKSILSRLRTSHNLRDIAQGLCHEVLDQEGAPASKLNLGMGSYGNTFTLQSSSNNGVGAPSTGPGKAGPYTQGAGVLAYNEVRYKTSFRTKTWERDSRRKENTDDIALIAEEKMILRDMLQELNDSYEQYRLKINANKGKIMVIGRKVKKTATNFSAFMKIVIYNFYVQICEQHNAGQWTQHWNADQKCIYASNGNQWVGFDNIAAVKIKAQYIKNNGLGGAMIWSIDMDDFRNTCGDGKYPLLNTIKTYIA